MTHIEATLANAMRKILTHACTSAKDENGNVGARIELCCTNFYITFNPKTHDIISMEEVEDDE